MAAIRAVHPKRRRRRLSESPLAVYEGLEATQTALDEKKDLLKGLMNEGGAAAISASSSVNNATLASPLGMNSTATGTPLDIHQNALGLQDLNGTANSDCPTTVFLIVLVHILYLYQWNARRSRKQVLVSYRKLVQKKQFYKIWLALLSHPPLRVGRDRSGRPSEQLNPPQSSSIAMGDADSSNTNNHHQLSHQWERIKTKAGPWLDPFIRGHASGLPLLVYNSHIIWSCRALEGKHHDDAFHYARLLLALAMLAISLELAVSHRLLQSKIMALARYRFQSIQPDETADAVQRIRKRLLHRTMGTLTGACTALMLVFRTVFLQVPLPILPFLPNPFFLNDPGWTCSVCILLLLLLSNSSLTGSSVLAGSVVGILWPTGWFQFLIDAHWGSYMLLLLVVVSALSLKANPDSAALVPCVERVSWDHNGQVVPVDGQRFLAPLSTGNANDDDDAESDPLNETDDEGDDDDSVEPVASGGAGVEDDDDVEASRRAFPRQDDSQIYGRLPVIGEMNAEDSVGGEDVPLNRSAHSNVRSRRGGGPTATITLPP